jgi:hypothetical protein
MLPPIIKRVGVLITIHALFQRLRKFEKNPIPTTNYIIHNRAKTTEIGNIMIINGRKPINVSR